METDQDESDARDTQKQMLKQIVALPATLYFPSEIVLQLNEACAKLGYTPEELVVEALKGQIQRWDEFFQYVSTPPASSEDFIWPEDPLFCLACVSTVHFINTFRRCFNNPMAFAQLKAAAPPEWSFASFEELDEPDPGDWWKAMPDA